jgi:hypothetical protein
MKSNIKPIILCFLAVFIMPLYADDDGSLERLGLPLDESTLPNPIKTALPELKNISEKVYSAAVKNTRDTEIKEATEGYRQAKAYCVEKFMVVAYKKAPDIYRKDQSAYLVDFQSGTINNRRNRGVISQLAYILPDGSLKLLWPQQVTDTDKHIGPYYISTNDYINAEAFAISPGKIGIAIENEWFKYWGPYILFYQVTSSETKLVAIDHGRMLNVNNDPRSESDIYEYTRATCYFADFNQSGAAGILICKIIGSNEVYSSYIYNADKDMYVLGSDSYTEMAKKIVSTSGKSLPRLDCRLQN